MAAGQSKQAWRQVCLEVNAGIVASPEVGAAKVVAVRDTRPASSRVGAFMVFVLEWRLEI